MRCIKWFSFARPKWHARSHGDSHAMWHAPEVASTFLNNYVHNLELTYTWEVHWRTCHIGIYCHLSSNTPHHTLSWAFIAETHVHSCRVPCIAYGLLDDPDARRLPGTLALEEVGRESELKEAVAAIQTVRCTEAGIIPQRRSANNYTQRMSPMSTTWCEHTVMRLQWKR